LKTGALFASSKRGTVQKNVHEKNLQHPNNWSRQRWPGSRKKLKFWSSSTLLFPAKSEKFLQERGDKVLTTEIHSTLNCTYKFFLIIIKLPWRNSEIQNSLSFYLHVSVQWSSYHIPLSKRKNQSCISRFITKSGAFCSYT
jgi:hypothetical protein